MSIEGLNRPDKSPVSSPQEEEYESVADKKERLNNLYQEMERLRKFLMSTVGDSRSTQARDLYERYKEARNAYENELAVFVEYWSRP